MIIGAAHIARRTAGAVPALTDLAISLFFPKITAATTTHLLALQTSYVSPATGDSTAAVNSPVEKTMVSWPFLTGIDVATSPRAAAGVAFGSSTTDGDGSTLDANRRWPDVLAERLNASTVRDSEVGARAHRRGIRVIGTTIPPFENATLYAPAVSFFTPEKEIVRQKANTCIRGSAEFDDVVDFDVVLRDPERPARLLPIYHSGDHLHANDAGYVASGKAIPIELFGLN